MEPMNNFGGQRDAGGGIGGGQKNLAGVIALTAIITALVVGGIMYLWLGQVPFPATTETPTPVISPTGSPASIGPSDWLIYSNPTYGITMKYPPFYKYTKRTNAFETQDTPFGSRASLNNHLQINVYTRSLNGYSDSNMDMNWVGDFNYSFSTNSGWELKDSVPQEGQSVLQELLPKLYTTKNGIKTYVTGVFHQGSAGIGWPLRQVSYIESADKTFIIRLQVDWHDAEEPAKTTDQTIYQILDTLQLTTPQPNTIGWKTFSSPQLSFQYPPSWKIKGTASKVSFDIPNEAGGIYGPIFTVSIDPNQGGITLEEWHQELKNQRWTKHGQISIGNMTFYELWLTDSDAPARYIGIVGPSATTPQGRVWQRWMIDISARANEEDQILSTFKFIE